MAYADEAAKPGRIPLVFIEMDMDCCSRTYGTAPCTAAVGTTGDRKCYNTYATCQDTANFAKGTATTYRFCEENAAVPVGVSAIPLLRRQGVSFAPQRITPGKGLGIRAAVTVRFKDAPWPDADLDPYLSTRTHDTTGQGSFWGKFRARNRFYEGRPLRIRSGYVVPGEAFSWDNFQTRVYILDNIRGPGRDNSVDVVAKDILKLADDKRAQCPRPSKGQLLANLAAGTMSFTLTPSGIGNAEYPASGRLVIGGEGMDFTRSGDAVTLTTRDVYGTGAKSHNAGDTVQLVQRYSAAEIQDVIYDLLTTFAGISTSYIDKPAWDAERDAYLAGVWTADLCEPTGVNTLIGELTEQGTCNVWWDEVAQEIIFRAMRPATIGLPERSDEDHFLSGSVAASEDPSQRVSQVLVYFGQIDPTKRLDEPNNYRTRYLTPDPDGSGGTNQHGSELQKKLYSRWFQQSSLARVQDLATSLLNSYRHPPRLLEFDLDAADALATGDLFYANTRYLQDDTGANVSVNMQVLEVHEKVQGSRFSLKAQENIFSAVSTGTVYLLSSQDVNLYNAYVTENGVPSAAVTVTFVIPSGVLIGSSSAYSPALTNPASWPAGSTITLVNHGRIQGAGGQGGQHPAGPGETGTPRNGVAGGTALEAAFAITVDNTDGLIYGGGGGGGSGLIYVGGFWTTSSGGGGAGSAVGLKGINAVNGSGAQNGTLDAGGAGDTGGGTGGGAGGSPGTAGANGTGTGTLKGVGGAAGKAVVGNSFITWTATGTRLGPVT